MALLLISLFSCGNKEIQLPQSNETVVADVKDHSPIYLFFKIDSKDTLIEVNRKNSISSTNWLFNIDKRLPLKLVIPEIQKLQAKKEGSAHKSETAENYFTYMDSSKKSLAFFSFTKVKYKMEEPKFGIIIYFDKHNKIKVYYATDRTYLSVKKEKLQKYLISFSSDKPNKFLLCFDKQMSLGNYIQNKIFIKSLKFSMPNMNLISEEFIF